MKITADVREYAAGLSDNEKGMFYPHPEEGAKAPVSKDQEAGSAGGGTGTKEYAQAGMDQMSKKFIDMGAEVYVDEAKVAKESNKAL